MISMDNIINIGVNLPGKGASEFNTANILVLTDEEHIGGDEYGIYLGSSAVAVDWGSNSKSLIAAQSIFAQSPSIKNNGGYLVVAELKKALTTIQFSAEPVTGDFELDLDGTIKVIGANDTEQDIQELIREVAGFENVVVERDGLNINLTSTGSRGEVLAITVGNSTLQDINTDPVSVTITEEIAGESILEAVQRLKEKVEFVGVLETFEASKEETLEVAPYIQEQNNSLLRAFAEGDTDTLEEGGVIKEVLDQGFTRTRALFKTGTPEDRLKFKAAYLSQNMSVNFSQAGSTRTDHLKDLVGVTPDDNIDDQLLLKVKEVGAVCYPRISGATAKVFSSGANTFFDRVFNLIWFINAALVAYYNVLARTSTKIAQTESGMISITGAIARVCDRAVVNGYCAPGEWTSEDTFGDPETFKRNIREKGYYIYHLPLSQQDPQEREERVAPVIMVALKEAGAIHKGNVIVSINA